MKRSLICFLLAVALCVSGVAYAAVTLNDRSDEVTYTETVLLGDPSMVEGVTVTADVSLMSQLFWTTGHTLGEQPETAVDYTYYPERQRSSTPSQYDGIYLSSDIDYYVDEEKDISELSGLNLAFRELYDSASVGKEVRKLIRLSDYYEFYPIGARIELPGVKNLHWGSDFYSDPPLDAFDENGVAVLEDGTVVEMGPEMLNIRAFQNFFKIPVVEDHVMEIHLERGNGHGLNYGMGNGAYNATEEELEELGEVDWFDFTTRSTWTDTACYFTFDPKTQNGDLVDTGHIPGGYGIYRLPLDPDHAENELGFDARELEMVYLLDPTDSVVGLKTNRDGKDLLLLTVEEDTAFLTVIDTAAMQARQRIELLRGKELYVDSVQIFEDFMTFWISKSEPAIPPEGVEIPEGEERTEYVEHVSVLTWEEAGEYTVEFMVESEQDADNGEKKLYRPSHPELDWNGEELVMCGHLFDYTRNYGTDTCGYVVAVYDETGMTYYAEYASSLKTGNSNRSCDRGETVICWP